MLFLNHVLQQEPEARQRLARQKGRVVAVRSGASFAMQLVATPAGLLDLAAPDAHARPDADRDRGSPLDLAQAALRGDKPAVRIEGDVQLAAEVNWLVDHVRWDVEEDLSRVIGDAPAHAHGPGARAAWWTALRQFVGARRTGRLQAPARRSA